MQLFYLSWCTSLIRNAALRTTSSNRPVENQSLVPHITTLLYEFAWQSYLSGVMVEGVITTRFPRLQGQVAYHREKKLRRRGFWRYRIRRKALREALLTLLYLLLPYNITFGSMPKIIN